MSTPALATRGLCKNFGSLAVTQNVEIDVPQGARYALIGPNGAGKTTLINLMTGQLKPDKGAVSLNGEDISALEPDTRVKRGLTRTFQINQLFPNLSALEAVTLAVLERQRTSGIWWRKLPAFGAAIEEAHSILQSLRFGEDSERVTRELPYGRQRLLEIALALATKPKVLLLDEPAAGVPKDESAELFRAIAGLPSDITVLFIEHDMDLVFRFASRIIVLFAGGVLVEGTPAEISADPRVREVYLGKGHRHG
jgi:ABC-type branched-subunit amino acid transport system ATPase component